MVANTEDDDDSQEGTVNYKAQYRNLKRKLKFLIYENECFQEALRSTQRRLLKASRDRSFLLDRLLTFEKVEASSSEGENTESSDDGESGRSDPKRRRIEVGSNVYGSAVNSGGPPKAPTSVKKKKAVTLKPAKPLSQPQLSQIVSSGTCNVVDGHMTPEQVERHLESRQRFLELDKTPTTIPTEMFSNDPSLDR